MTSVSVAPATPEQFGEAAALIDAEFLRRRGRGGSAASRFPGLMTGRGEAMVAVAHDQVAATAIWRPFTWCDGDRTWAAAMVGCVVTDPRHRGRGIGTALMRGVRTRLIAHGAQVVVLWARRQEFYTRLGWLPADRGVRCEISGDPDGRLPPQITSVQPAAQVAGELLEIHRRHASRRVQRTPDTYATVPPPSEQVTAHIVGGEAYVLVGSCGQHRYVLEFAGATAHLPILWDAVRAGSGPIVVNEQQGSAAQRHLAQERGLCFQAQDLALWLPLEPGVTRACLLRWYIPWIDRI
jgi:GNAT superfamily N-acetyltransferase